MALRLFKRYPVLNHAHEVLLLASGRGKAQILQDIFDPAKKNNFPVQAVQPQDGRLVWVVDRDAAGLLQRT